MAVVCHNDMLGDVTNSVCIFVDILSLVFFVSVLISIVNIFLFYYKSVYVFSMP